MTTKSKKEPKSKKEAPKAPVRKEASVAGEKAEKAIQFGDHLLDTKDNRVFVFQPEFQEIVDNNPGRFVLTTEGITKNKP